MKSISILGTVEYLANFVIETLFHALYSSANQTDATLSLREVAVWFEAYRYDYTYHCFHSNCQMPRNFQDSDNIII